MKYRLLDLLACPACKGFPLKHIVADVSIVNRDLSKETPLCELYCGYLSKYVKNIKEYPCLECINIEIDIGILICESCGRWYPIEQGIPRMLPDELRDIEEDKAFIERYRNKLLSALKRSKNQ